jgi:hypothetical protein
MDRAPSSREVPAVKLHEPLPGDLSQPWVKRNLLFPHVLWQPLKRFRQRLLNDVRRIDPSADSLVQIHGDHATKPRPVTDQQLLGGRLIARRRPLQELIRIWRLFWHQQPIYIL